jgi:hypothetical protein
LARLTLSTFLREGSNPEDQRDAESDRCHSGQSIKAVAAHHAPAPDENKSEIDLAQRFRGHDTVPLEHLENKLDQTVIGSVWFA